jgi:putative protease
MEIEKLSYLVEPVRPEILAPAGGKKPFVAVLAAGADAIYCGLKSFSARMAAENFSIDELGQLTQLAHDQGKKVYIPINTMIKSDELDMAGRLLDQLNRWVAPDALIVQDLAMLSLVRQTGFSGEIHLSTLANITFPAALELVRKFPEITRVVLPRELSIDEIKMVAAACPKGLSLEVFIHGALCYAVSGRCYWSSYMGGKIGLRGRCVQPCRRVYSQDSQKNRFFSCQDLSIDVLTKIIANVPQVSSLKIEGRKKGAHYVYYTVSAYRLLRDHSDDPKAKKTALSFLDYALGRKGTHYNFLPQRPQNPVDLNVQTGSGLMIGSVKGERAKSYVVPREALYANDMLRIGYEDDAWHTTIRVSKYVPKKGQLFLKFASHRKPQNNTPVFLIDRRGPEVEKEMSALEKQLDDYPVIKPGTSSFKTLLPSKKSKKSILQEMRVIRSMQGLKQNTGDQIGVWLASDTQRIMVGDRRRSWYWLPPVIWPDDQEKIRSLVKEALKKGCMNFVLNSPWQRVFFPQDKNLNLWAGPFCNIANELAIEQLAGMQFKGVIVSPEQGKADYAGLPSKSPLPMGIVVSGNWPLCVSRIIADDLKTDHLFNSPKGEQAWVRQYGSDFWVFPNWQVDLTPKTDVLKKAGYTMLVHLSEPLPKKVKLKQRPGLWNWEIGLQ